MTPHDKLPPRHQRRLVQGSPDRLRLTFQWERFAKIHGELLPLFQRHYDEIALDRDVVPLDPDWNYYASAELAGVLHILTARAASNRKLAGYIFNIIGTHNHYKSTRFCNTDMFWLHPHFRKGWQPVKMFLENLRGLETFGVDIGLIYFKLNFQNARVGKLLARLGYEPTDIVMRKRFV